MIVSSSRPAASMPLVQRRVTWLLPLVFFELYLSLSVALFFWGPWPWPVASSGKLLTFLLSSQVAIALGYCLAAYVPGPKVQIINERRVRHFFDICLVISLFMFIPTSLARTGYYFPHVLEGIHNAGQTYLANYLRLLKGNEYLYAEYLRILLSLFLTAMYPLLVYLWGGLNWVRRSVGLLLVVLNVLLYISIGTNKGIADTLIVLPFLLLAAHASGSIKVNFFRARYIVIFLVVFALFLGFFAMGQYQRVGGVGPEGFLPTGEFKLYADRANGLYAQWMPPPLVVFYESFARYLCQGYYALSMSLPIETPSTYGVGHSMFLTRNADALFHTDYFTVNSVPYVLEETRKWGRMTLWHSIYPWLASDVGFWGVLPVMAGFSFLLSLSWRRAIDRQGIVWVVMLYLMLVLFFYIPANNQIFQSGETTAAFCCTFLWIVFRGERWFFSSR